MGPKSQMASEQEPVAVGKGASVFELDCASRDDLRYFGKNINKNINSIEDKWRLLPAFLQTKGLVKQHIDSFNYFIETDIHNILRANHEIRSDVDPKFFIRFVNVNVEFPRLTDTQSGLSENLAPHQCRLRDITYAAQVTMEVHYTRGQELVKKRGLEVFKLPIMLKSKRCVLAGKSAEEVVRLGDCPLDPGGYFIIRGVEKVILIQEQLSKNRIIVETDRDGEISANVTSSTHEKKSKTTVFQGKLGKIYLKHNSMTVDMPIIIILKALGIESDREIAELICGNDPELLNFLAPTFEDVYKTKDDKVVFTQHQALDYIGAKIRVTARAERVGIRKDWAEEAEELLATTVLAHVPVETINGQLQFRPKAIYLALMVRRILQAKKDGGIVDDRDFVGNKRLELAGQLISLLFEDLFKTYISQVKKEVDKHLAKKNRTQVVDAGTVLKSNGRFITDNLFRAISSGVWNVKRFKMERAGVSQILTRLSYVSALGMLTRIASQFEKTRKVSGPRALQTSQWGMLCPSDTPEGEACGLIKNLALFTHITTDSPSEPVLRLIFVLGVEDINILTGSDIYGDPNTFIVFLNGVIIGVHRDPNLFVTNFRKLRRTGRIQPFVSVYSSGVTRTINISSDGGRVCRPLIIVDMGRPLLTDADVRHIMQGTKVFEDLVTEGKLEYVDVNEESDCNIAIYEQDIYYDKTEPQRLAKIRMSILHKMREREILIASGRPPPPPMTKEESIAISQNTTHLEIAPFTVLGAVAGLIPYPHHNQSPRNTYQCAMGKQAIGAIAYNQLNRMDTLLYLMVYPQHPMVRTRTIELIGFDKIPAGQNASVAVMSYSGYDIEDALVLNRASLDRGFGRCQALRKHAVTLKRYANGSADRLVIPVGENISDEYEFIEEDGTAGVGCKIRTKQAVIAKQTPNETSYSTPNQGEAAMRPDPVRYKYPEWAVVDKVIYTTNDEDLPVVKVNIRQTRRPELGDKFSSRHGQKGVCGNIVSQEDMPFNDQGVCPDIIMNPHGFPSRMTVGKMIELLAGKAGVFDGSVQYGTCFGGSKVEDMSRILIDHGFSYSGKDYLTSGITGEPLSAYIFFGPVYYQKLKHMVMDKMHARARGPRTTMTRQPTEGRSKEGGLRVGEMERDCLIGHGTSSLLIERLLQSSDEYEVSVCRKCGLIGAWKGQCKMCDAGAGIANVKMPFACKLLFQELICMNVVPRLTVEDLD